MVNSGHVEDADVRLKEICTRTVYLGLGGLILRHWRQHQRNLY